MMDLRTAIENVTRTSIEFVTRNGPIRRTQEVLEKSDKILASASGEIRRLKEMLQHLPTILLIDVGVAAGDAARRDCSDGKVRLLLSSNEGSARIHLKTTDCIDLAILDWRLEGDKCGGDLLDECLAVCHRTCILTAPMPIEEQQQIKAEYGLNLAIVEKPVALHEVIQEFLGAGCLCSVPICE